MQTALTNSDAHAYEGLEGLALNKWMKELIEGKVWAYALNGVCMRSHLLQFGWLPNLLQLLGYCLGMRFKT